MTPDIDLIYGALLRAERHFEEWPERDPTMAPQSARFGMLLIQTIREEIGRTLGNSDAVMTPAEAFCAPDVSDEVPGMNP